MMESTFWDLLPRPIIGLAPMDGVGDHAFRHIQKKYGAPMVIYTEFTAADRLEIGDHALLKDFFYDESQRPIIAQVFGHIPDLFRRMAVMLCQLGFDGIDINMGCPAPNIAQRGAGAGLIRTPELAQEIVRATRVGVRAWQEGARLRDDRGAPPHLVAQVEAFEAKLPAAYRLPRAIPVSVKTRIGYDEPVVDEWIPRLLESEPDAIALHGRTLRQGYSGTADWEAIARAAELARQAGVPVLGNGDARSLEDAHHRAADYGLGGVLIGRASYGNPFAFRPGDAAAVLAGDPYRLLRIAVEHAQLHAATIGRDRPQRFLGMRKHLGWYARNVPGASGLRRDLVRTSSAEEVEALVTAYLAYRAGWEGMGARPRPTMRQPAQSHG